MTSIPLPQSPSDSREVMRSIDEKGDFQFGQVGFQELDFGAVFGGKTTSTSQNSIAYGLQTFTLDIDDGKIIRGCKVEITSLDDTDCWEIGIVASKDLTVSPAEIVVFIKKISPLVNTSKNWEIQIVDDAAANVATLGYSADSKQFGASNDIFVGAIVSVTTDAGKLFKPGSFIVFEALADGTQYFRGLGQAYDSTTGDISVVVTDVGPEASGTSEGWSLFAQDGPGADATLIATSATSQTISDGYTQRTFTTQSGKTFIPRALVKAQSASNAANVITGQIFSYSGTTLVMNTFHFSGSGSPTDWVLTGLPGPLGNVSAGVNSLFANFASGGIEINSNAGGPAIALLNSSPANVPTLASAITFKYDNQGGTVDVDPLLSFLGNGASLPSGTLWTGQTNLTNMSATARTITMAGDATISGTNTGDQNLSGYLTSAIAALTYVPQTTTVNGHALSANVTVTLSDVGAAAQSDMETATSTSLAVTPGRQHYHPAHPKAVGAWTITPTAVTGSVNAVNASTDVVTWSTNHGLTTGQQIRGIGTVPAGWTVAQAYYVNALSATTFALYLTLVDAKADTNRVNITATTTGATIVKYVLSGDVPKTGGYGLDSACPVGLITGTTSLGLEFNLSPSLSGTVALAEANASNFFDAAGTTQRLVWIQPFPTSIASNLIKFSGLVGFTPTAVVATGTLVNQGTSAFQASIKMWADL